MKSNQHGFTLVETLLVVIAVTLIGFTGWYVWDANRDDKTPVTSAKSSTDKVTTAKPAADPTANWTAYESKTGKFSLRYPSNWVTASNQDMCSDNVLLLGPSKDSVGACGSDGGGQVLISSYDATSESGSALSAEYYSGVTLENVTVDGVAGTKQTGTYNYTGPGIGPKPGTKTIKYHFNTQGKAIQALYEQEPTFPDVSADFNLIVTKTLNFN